VLKLLSEIRFDSRKDKTETAQQIGAAAIH